MSVSSPKDTNANLRVFLSWPHLNLITFQRPSTSKYQLEGDVAIQSVAKNNHVS